MTTTFPAPPVPQAPPARAPHLFSVDEYFRLYEIGVIPAGARHELIRGGVVGKRFSPAEYGLMIEAGILPPGAKYELIHGEVEDVMGQGDLHAVCIEMLGQLLVEILAGSAAVRGQCPLALSGSTPEPDFVVCPPIKRRGARHPVAAEAFLVIEVSDSSLAYDRTTKLALYAGGGVAEYWIINLSDDCVEVHTQPDAACGTYASRIVYRRNQSLTFTIGTQNSGPVPVDALLP